MSFQFHRCTSKFCRQNWWPCSLVLPTWSSAQPRCPPVVNSLLAIVVHMCMYFLRRKPVTVKRNILHAGYEILYLPLVKLLSISTFFYMKKKISCDSKNLQYAQLAYYRILLPFSSSLTVSRLSFLILCRSLIARARTPTSKCVAVGEFAGDIGI